MLPDDIKIANFLFKSFDNTWENNNILYIWSDKEWQYNRISS